VLDASARQALAACRALGRVGHRVAAAAAGGDLPFAFFSRHVRARHVLPDPAGPRDAYAAALGEAIARGRYDVVVSVDDLTLARLGSLAVPVPTMPLLGRPFDRLVDKLELAGLSASAGVDYPVTASMSDAAPPIGSALEWPLVVKSRRSAVVDRERGRHAGGAQVVRSLDELEAGAQALVAEGHEPIVQERTWTPTKVNAVIIRRDGRSELRYAHQAVREHPREGGMGITLETLAPTDPAAAAALGALERVCDAAGYEGLAQAEFYVAPEDGRAWLVDVNPRLWGSTWFAERLGLRVTERAVWVSLGRRVTAPPAYPAGRRFHHTFSELRWIAAAPSRSSAAIEVLRSTGRRDLYEFSDVSDPGPLVRFGIEKLRRLAGRSSALA
jgi:biotin carboxylase